MKRSQSIVINALIAGLVAAAALLLLRPQTFSPLQPVVEFRQISVDAEAARPAPPSHRDAVKKAAPAVVNVYTTKLITERVHPHGNDPLWRYFFGRRGQERLRSHRENSLGSGVLVSPKGYILTNNHVIDGADEILVALRDGRKVPARLVGSDPESDLAVLKIDLPDLPDLPSITLGRSESLEVGDVVLAIGNPFGVGQTVTMGIISATGRSQLGINRIENFIQTDAAINPGNSGGALVNPYGELVGINSAIFSKSGGYQGIGFAIPVRLAKGVMEQIIEQGRVVRGWLGVELQDVPPKLARSFGLGSEDGALVAGVVRDSPAYRAGIKPGDVLTSVDHHPIGDATDLMNNIIATAPGTEISFEGMRGRRKFSTVVTVGHRPAT